MTDNLKKKPYQLEKPAISLHLKKVNGWGGYRIGSGRNAKRLEDKRVRLSTTIKPETKAWLNAEWHRTRCNQGTIIDYLVAMVSKLD